MPDGTVPLLIALIILVLFSAFFSSTETAFSCANKIKLRSMWTSGNKRAGKVLKLAEENYGNLITTILVGNNIVNLTAATLSTLFFAKVITEGTVDASLISTIVITLAVLIFGEITPKFLAKTAPEKTAMAYYPIIICFYYIFYPFNLIFGGWKWLLGKVFRIKEEQVITEAEIMTVVEEAEEDGTLKEEETNLIRSVIEFDDLEVGDILVPRVNVAAVGLTDSMDTIKDVFVKEGYSRLPVYRGSIDTIVGTIHQKDFFSAYINGKTNIEDILVPLILTTEHIKISALLKQMQKKKIHIAVVLDEYGGTLGLVTLEDILEELVGEIWDEHDEEINYFKRINESTYIVDCNAPLCDLFEMLDLKGEDEEFEANTVSGWIIEMLGEIPHAGKSFSHKHFTVEILKSTVRRVLQAKITINTKVED
ncbi:MAG: HlyC/CorC family transporter [Clostridia bacterium]|nr:HlyC/CorC family transporter [Clostridia bacterium]